MAQIGVPLGPKEPVSTSDVMTESSEKCGVKVLCDGKNVRAAPQGTQHFVQLETMQCFTAFQCLAGTDMANGE
ncbi:hypothetical protein MRX96_036485 [Rhipicephalus microplus]